MPWDFYSDVRESLGVIDEAWSGIQLIVFRGELLRSYDCI